MPALDSFGQPIDWDALTFDSDLTELDPDQRWSTWNDVAHHEARGPRPYPDWVVQHDGAIDTELGILKTGKEADALLIERALPEEQRTGETGERTLLVAKRYRDVAHRSYGMYRTYLAGTRMRDSPETRALQRGTTYGREVAANLWASREFERLTTFYAAGLPVPYPVQVDGTELLLEFIGIETEDEATAAGRLVHTDADVDQLAAWAAELRDAVVAMAALGWAHADFSPYNVLAQTAAEASAPRLTIIDLPQAVDLALHPDGLELLRRDCVNLTGWFTSHGVPEDADEWFDEAVAHAWTP